MVRAPACHAGGRGFESLHSRKLFSKVGEYMLSKIRDKMSTWVVGVLLLLVAVPLVFMGLGNYQSSAESYAFKINDQVISTSQLEQ